MSTTDETNPITQTSFRRVFAVTVDRKALLEALSEAQRFADPRATMPIVGMISLRPVAGSTPHLAVTATDLDLCFREYVPATVSSSSEGDEALANLLRGPWGAAAEARKLRDVVKAMTGAEAVLELTEEATRVTAPLRPGTRKCAEEGCGNSPPRCGGALLTHETTERTAGTVKVSCGRSRFSLEGARAADAPKPEDLLLTTAKWSSLDRDVLSDLVEGVFASISEDYTRAHLCSMRLEIRGDRLRAISTDGHRAALLDRHRGDFDFVGGKSDGVAEDRAGRHVLVPRAFAAELRKLVKAAEKAKRQVELAVSGGRVFARVEGSKRAFAARLVDAMFPPYEQVIPKTSERAAVVRRDELADSVRRLLLVAGDNKGILLDFRGDKAVLSSGNGTDSAEEDLPVLAARNLTVSCDGPRDGEAFRMAVSGKYLLDAILKSEAATVWIGMSDREDKWSKGTYEDSVPCYGEQDPLVTRDAADSLDTYVVMPIRI